MQTLDKITAVNIFVSAERLQWVIIPTHFTNSHKVDVSRTLIKMY